MAATPRKNRTARRILAAGAGLVTVGALVAAMPSAGAAGDRFGGGHGHGHDKGKGRLVDVQLLSFNDLHGNLEPPAGSSGQVTRSKADGTTEKVDAGGVEYLATHLRRAREGNRYSVTAAAGDLIGASPLLSGLFHDEPTVGALNKLDLDVTS
ncbi:bifunctional metallophosphatase/5'-nucleotidase, partial [Streptomyces sp. NPDC006324]